VCGFPSRIHRSFDDTSYSRRRRKYVAGVRAEATDVDVSIRPRKEWARLYEQKQLAKA
jgi:hypothetical protein